MNDEITLDAAGDDYGAAAAQPSLIKRYLSFLKKWWWIPMFTALLSLGGALYYVSKLPSSYSSFARMGVLGRAKLSEANFYADEPTFFFQTQIELMRSPQMAERANGRLQTSLQGKKPPKVKLRIGMVAKTTMLDLEASSRDASFTKFYLDAIMAEYIRYRRELRELASQSTLDSLIEQIQTQEKTVRETQDKMNKFLQEHNDVVLQNLGVAEATYLGTLKKEFADLKLQRDLLNLILLDRSPMASNRLDLLTPDPLRAKDSSQTAPGTTSEFANARQRIQELRVQLDELTRNLRTAHPKVQKLTKDIELAEKTVQEYRKLSQEQVLAQKHELELKMTAWDNMIVDQDGKVMVTSKQLAEFKRLDGDVTRELLVYDNLRHLQRSVGLGSDTEQEAMTVIEPASPASPTDRKVPLILTFALVAGMAFGFGIVFLIERSDDRFISLIEFTHQFNELVVGQVPELPRAQSRNGLALLQPGDGRHMFAESNRNLRSSLLYMSSGERRPKTILVASAVPNEGKSTVAANLARTMAFGGARVLLVDADLRRGTQHQFLELSRAPGLADYLRGACSLGEAIRETSLPNLSLVPSGQVTNDAGELLLNPRMDHLIKTAYSQFDYVVFDSAPVFAADDTPTLSPKMDGILFVVRGSFTRAKFARQALEMLRHRRVNILGIVFNRVNSSSDDYYYYKYSNYDTASKSASA